MKSTIRFASSAVLVTAALLASPEAAVAAPITNDPFVAVGAGTSPRSVAVSVDGEFFVAAYGTNAVNAYTAAGTAEPARSVSMGSGQRPIDVAVDNSGAVWTANIGAHSLGWFMPGDSTAVLIDLGTGRNPEAVSLTAGNVAYTVNGISDTLSKSEKTGMIFQTTPVFATLPAGSNPVALATSASGTVYTANAGNSTVSSVTSAGAVTGVVAQLAVGGAPDAIAVDSKGMVYVAVTNADSVVKIDPAKPSASSIVATCRLDAGAKPFGLAVDARDNVYVTNRATSSVSVIPAEATVATTIQTMPVGSGVSGVAVTSENLLLTTSFARGVVSSLDLNTRISLTEPTPDIQLGESVAGAFTSTGVDPVVYSSVDLPVWLTLDPASGAFSGRPTAPGSVSFTVRAKSLVSESNPIAVAFTVIGPVPTTAPPTSSGAGAGVPSGGSSGRAVLTGSRSLAHTGVSSEVILSSGILALVFLGAGVDARLARARRRAV